MGQGWARRAAGRAARPHHQHPQGSRDNWSHEAISSPLSRSVSHHLSQTFPSTSRSKRDGVPSPATSVSQLLACCHVAPSMFCRSVVLTPGPLLT